MSEMYITKQRHTERKLQFSKSRTFLEEHYPTFFGNVTRKCVTFDRNVGQNNLISWRCRSRERGITEEVFILD